MRIFARIPLLDNYDAILNSDRNNVRWLDKVL